MPLYAGAGRPVRSNRGIGGQRAQLEKASTIVGEGLLNKVTGQKRDRSNLGAVLVPEDLPENDLAPPIPNKRARINTSKAVISFLSSTVLSLTCTLSADFQSYWPSRTASPSCAQARSNHQRKRVSIWISHHIW